MAKNTLFANCDKKTKLKYCGQKYKALKTQCYQIIEGI